MSIFNFVCLVGQLPLLFAAGAGEKIVKQFAVQVYLARGKLKLWVTMTLLTILMTLFLLCLAPLKITICFKANLSCKRLQVVAKLFFIPMLREVFWADGFCINCSGTVQTRIDLRKPSGNGKIFLKAISFCNAEVFAGVNFCQHGVFAMVATEVLCAAAAAIAGAFFTGKVRIRTGYSVADSVFGKITLSTSLCEILTSLVGAAVAKAKPAKPT